MRFTLAGGWCCAIVAILIVTAAVPCEAQVSLRIGKTAADEERLEQALLRRGSLEAIDAPLSEVIVSLSQQFHVPIVLLKRRLEEAGVAADTPVSVQFESLPLETLLDHALRELELAFTVRGGVILVTTREDLESDLETRVYPVRDLVLWRVPGADGADRFEADYDSLIDLIKTTLSPDTWDDVGGPGSIMEFDKSASIVVSQTRDVHRQIEPLLATLRKARELQGIASIPVPKNASALILPRIADGPPDVAISPPAQAWQMPRVYSD